MKTMGQNIQTRIIAAALVFVMVFASIVSAGLAVNVDFGDFLNSLGFGTNKNSGTNLSASGEIGSTFVNKVGNYGYIIGTEKRGELTLDGERDDAYDNGVTISAAHNMPASASTFDVTFAATENYVYVLYEFTKVEEIFYPAETHTAGLGALYWFDCVDFVLDLTGAGVQGKEFNILGKYEGDKTTAKISSNPATAGVENWYVKHTDAGYNVEFIIPMTSIAVNEDGNREMFFTALSTITTSYDGANAPVRAYTAATSATGNLNKAIPSSLVITDGHEKADGGRYKYTLEEATTALNGTADGIKDEAYDEGLYFVNLFNSGAAVPATSEEDNFSLYVAADSANVYFFYEVKDKETFSGGTKYYYNDCAELIWNLTGANTGNADVRIYGEAEGVNHYETAHAAGNSPYKAPYGTEETPATGAIDAINKAKSNYGLKSYAVKHTEDGYNVEYVISRENMAYGRIMGFLACGTFSTSDAARSYAYGINSANKANDKKDTLNILEIVPAGYEEFVEDNYMDYSTPDYKLEGGTRWGYFIYESADKLVTDGYRDMGYKSGVMLTNTYNRAQFGYKTEADPDNYFDVLIAADDEKVNILFEFTDDNIVTTGQYNYYNDAAQFSFKKDGTATNYNASGAPANAPGVTVDFGPNGERVGRGTVDGAAYTYIVVETYNGFNIEFSFNRADILNGNTFGFMGLGTIADNASGRTYGFIDNAFKNAADINKQNLHQFQIIDKVELEDSKYDNILKDAGTSGTDARWQFYLDATEEIIYNDGYLDPAYFSGLKFDNHANRDKQEHPENTYTVYLAADDSQVHFFYEITDDFKYTYDKAGTWRNDCIHFRLGYDGSKNGQQNGTYNINYDTEGSGTFKIGNAVFDYTIVHTDKGVNVEITTDRKNFKNRDTFSYCGSVSIAWVKTDGKPTNTYGFTNTTEGTGNDPALNSYANQIVIVDEIAPAVKGDISDLYTNIGAAQAIGSSSMIFDSISSNPTSVAVIYPKEAPVVTKNLAQNVATATGGQLLKEGSSAISGYTYKIYVGHVTTSTEVKTMVETISYGKYGVGVYNNSVVIIGPTEQTLTKAVEVFKNELNSKIAANTMYTGTSAAVAGFDVPYVENARLVTDNGFGNYMAVKYNVSYDDFAEYCNTLTAKGYKLVQSNVMDGNFYSKTFYNATEIVTVTFGLHYSKFFEVNGDYRFTSGDLAGTEDSLRVNVGSRAVFDLPVNEVYDYDKFTDTVFVQLQTETSNLCDIVRLDDGTFVIFDSAHYDKTDEIMGELYALANGEVPVVRAWFITHFHQDHIGGLSSLSNIKGISDKIVIENVVMNLGSEYTYSTAWNKVNPSTGDKRNMENLLAGLENCGTNLVFGFAGQVFNFANASIEVLYTYSDSQPMNISVDSTNRTNSGYALTLLENNVEQKFIITGDSSFEQFNLAANRYGSYLKADVLQYPHHGGGEYGYAQEVGGSSAGKGGVGYNSVLGFYQAVNPKYILASYAGYNKETGALEGRPAEKMPVAEREFIGTVEAAGGKYLYNNGITLRLSVPYSVDNTGVGTDFVFPSYENGVFYYDEYYNTESGTQNEADGVKANPNDMITFPVGSTDNGNYIYVANTAYTNIVTDGVMDDIYTYGIHLKNDKVTNASINDVEFDVYVIAGQDGRLHVFYDVKDSARHNYTSWGSPNYNYRQDGIDFYFGLLGDGSYTTDIRIVGKNSSGATRFETQNAYYSGNNKNYFGEGKMFSDFVVVENSEGYTVEFSIDNNGTPFKNGDRFTFFPLVNSISKWTDNLNHQNITTGPDNSATSVLGWRNPNLTPNAHNILIFSGASAVDAAAAEAEKYGSDNNAGKYTGEVSLDTAIIGSVNNGSVSKNAATPQQITGINTVYTVPTSDGVMDNIYTYGYYTESKYYSASNEIVEANPHSFKAWMVYAEDGKMHVFIEVKDANILLGAKHQWMRDSIHFYLSAGNGNNLNKTYAFDANATTQGNNTVPADYCVTMTNDGYNVEFSFDRNGSPFRPGDTFEYAIYQNCIYGADETHDAVEDPLRYNAQSASYWTDEAYGFQSPWLNSREFISPNGGNQIHFEGVKIISRESATAIIVDGCAHKMVAVETVAPDCENDGYTVYTCTYCGYSENDDYVDATGHDYKAEVTAPDCENGGYTTYTCTVCGYSYTDDEVETEGHKYNKVVTDPTCTTDGYTTYTCTVCGDSYVDDEVETEGHKYNKVVTDPTCTTGGYTTYTCTVCGDSYTDDEVEAEGHKYNKVVTAPTCTTKGYTTYTCTVCGDSYTDDEVATAGHDFGDDCVCTVCGTKCTHNFNSNNVCTICGMEKFVFQTSMQAYLNLEDVVTMSVGYKTTNITNIDQEAYLERFGLLVWYTEAIDDADATYETSDAIFTETVYNSALGRFETTTEGIPAKKLGDAMCFRAYFINADGTYSYGRIISNYSAKKYCYSQLNKAISGGDTKNENLMLAILNYGAAAQEYFDYNTDNLMNSDLTEAQKTIAWDDSYVRSNYDLKAGMDAAFARSSTVTSRGAYLNLEGAIDISFYGKVSFTPVTATIYYWVESDIQNLDKLTLENAHSSEEMEWNDTLSRWEGKFEGQPAKSMFDTVYCCMVFTDSNGNVHYSGVVGYSPERYGYTNRNKGGATQNLARCLVNYGKAAVEYFGE